MYSVGERIKKIRLSKGITQADLADSLDTTTAAISRYELGKRELRFAQVQTIAEVLGVSVFELYGFPSEQQIQLENYQKMVDRAKEYFQHKLMEKPDETTQELDESFRLAFEDIEAELRGAISIAAIMHKSQVQETLHSHPDEEQTSLAPPKLDTASKRRNKRVDSLVSMFIGYPVDVQNRLLDVVSIFGQLNSVGQKHAVGRIKELAELPRYQVQQESNTEV